MGFAVLHIQKPKGNDSGTTAHIEWTVSPANADKERTPLNENLIEYPDGIETRTQAIQHRIENAGIKRKISHNQVRALQVMLSGTPEDMRRIQAAGKLDEGAMTISNGCGIRSERRTLFLPFYIWTRKRPIFTQR